MSILFMEKFSFEINKGKYREIMGENSKKYLDIWLVSDKSKFYM